MIVPPVGLRGGRGGALGGEAEDSLERGNSGKLIYPNLTPRLVIAKFVGMFCQNGGNSGKLICSNLTPRLVIAKFVGM